MAELPDELPDRGGLTLREWKLVDPEGFREYRRIVSLRHYYRFQAEYLAQSASERRAAGKAVRPPKMTDAQRKARTRELTKKYRAIPGRREAKNAYRRRTYAADPRQILASNERYVAAHPEWAAARNRLNQHRRRVAKSVPITPNQLLARMSTFAGCWVCGGPKDEIDHVKPVTRGGQHILSNLRPICLPCNRKKGNKWPLPIVMAWVASRRRMSAHAPLE